MTLWAKLRALLRREKLEAEMADEMRLHLELQAEKNMAAGMDADEARDAARRMFGGVEQIKERCREQRSWIGMEQVLKDFRFAARGLAKAPGFTAAVVVTLAIGIGATTAMVSIAHTILSVRPAFPEPERLVVLTGPDFQNPFNPVPSYPLFAYPHRFVALHEGTKAYAALGTQRQDYLNLIVDGAPKALFVQWVSDGFFAALAVRPQLGRGFSSDDFGTARDLVALLSWGIWTTQFAGDPAVVGKEILLGGRTRRVIGVLGKGFVLPSYLGIDIPPAVYLPEVHSPAPVFSPFRWMHVIGRLRDGVSIGAARAELTTFQYPGERILPANERAKQLPRVVPLTAYYPSSMPDLFWLFLAAAIGLFAIACANAANLLLSRTLGRSRELGVRLALGGGRWRIVRLVISEALLLALAGGAAGLFVAWGGCAAMRPLLGSYPGAGADGAGEILEPATIVATLGLSVLACLLATAAPAWRIWLTPLNDLLKDGFGSPGESRRLRRLRKSLVVVQAALAVALTIGTVLMTRSFWRLYRTDIGFKTENRLAVSGQLPEALPEEAFRQLAERVRENLANLPGVRNVTTASVVPLTNASASMGLNIEGRPEVGQIRFKAFSVSPEYFATLGLPILSGQGLNGLRPGDRRVALINRTAARRYFADRDPVGQWLDAGRDGRWEIIGVVGDVRESPRYEEVGSQLYVPFWQPPIYTLSLAELMLLEGRPTANFEATVRQAVYAADPRMVVHVTMLADETAARTKGERETMIILQGLGGLALALAAFGLFAVMAYSVAQRRREFGVRMALGAEPENLQALVLREGLKLVVFGVALGAAVAWNFTPLLNALLFETSARDPITFIVGPLVLVLVALVACWLPGRRAAKVDPMVALRCE